MSSTPKQSVLKTSSPEELSSIEILEQIRVKSTKDFWEVLLLEIWRNLEKLVPVCRTSSHRCIPNTNQRQALQTRTLKMQNYEKCWLHHCICRIEKTMNPLECQSQRWNLLHSCRKEGQVQKSAHAGLRKGLMSSSSQEPSAPWKPAALLAIGNEEPGDQFKSSVFRNAGPSNVGWSLLEGNKDHLLSQPKSELMREEHQVESFNSCVSELQQHAYAQRLEYKTHNTDTLNLDGNKFVYKKNYLWRERFFGILRSEVCTKWEKWREPKNKEETRSQCKKLSENHETIQKLTSQLQEMQNHSDDSKFSFHA